MYNRVVLAIRLLVLVIVTALSVSIIAPSIARANGRFPEAQTIETVPGGDGSTVFLRATFGVLVSRDAGKSWRWICERALGYDGQWDPPTAVTRDGRLWIGLEDGLASTKDGCDLDVAKELDGHTVKDLTTDTLGETLWAITGAPGKRGFVWRRSPGKTFEKLAGIDDTNLMTIEVAPTLASRIYVSGQPYSTIRGQIFRSDDGGKTFKTETGVRSGVSPGVGDSGAPFSSGLVADGPFFIGAIDREDPNRLLIRHLHAQGSDLLLTKDGGKTFKNVLSMKSAMFGFTKSPDGAPHYWAGSGLPEHGIFESTDRGEHFTSIANRGVLCLHAASTNALFVCENALAPGAPVIAVSRDQGKTTTPLARFSDVEGPVTCSTPDARASLCAGSWPAMKQLLSPLMDAGAVAVAAASASSQQQRPDAGTAPTARRSSCACGTPGTSSNDADLRCIIVGLFPLLMRVRYCIMRGSKLTQRT
jgi:hypothetical protein